MSIHETLYKTPKLSMPYRAFVKRAVPGVNKRCQGSRRAFDRGDVLSLFGARRGDDIGRFHRVQVLPADQEGEQSSK